MANALIVVDCQVDFCPGGSLAVENGDIVAKDISDYLSKHHDDYDVIVASKDWHIDPEGHFSDTPDYINTWPPHCVANTPGAEFHPNLDTTHIQGVFYKGLLTPAYSAFQGYKNLISMGLTPEQVVLISEPEEDDFLSLEIYLNERYVDRVDICGIATDYCVRATAQDAAESNYEYMNNSTYKTRVLMNLCAGVAEETAKKAVSEMLSAGVELVYG